MWEYLAISAPYNKTTETTFYKRKNSYLERGVHLLRWLVPTLIVATTVTNVVADDHDSIGALSVVEYLSAGDHTRQPAFTYFASTDEPAPLLVGLHQWSADFRSSSDAPIYAKWCINNGWHCILPNFRGPNTRPEATGSDLVIADVVSAVRYVQRNANVDPRRIYLVGASGGGYTSLLVAGRNPEPWAAVSAWVPITDLRAWHAQTKAAGRRYWEHIEASCGGPPGQSDTIDRQYDWRSPLTHLQGANGLPIDLNAGINDGHTGSVPISHTLLAYNLLADPSDRLADDAIQQMASERIVPSLLRYPGQDESYRHKRVLMRRQSGPVRVTIFDGGHELIAEAAMQWLALQRKAELAPNSVRTNDASN